MRVLVPRLSGSPSVGVTIEESPRRVNRSRGKGACGRPGRLGFTLVELVLAVAIAVGLLMVVLYFYRQAADLRTQLLQEAERISSIRLVMDRITSDLRCACSGPGTAFRLSGDANSLRFAKAAPPSVVDWTGNKLGRAAVAESDLWLVSYSLGSATEDTNRVITGLVRTEEPAVETRQVVEAARGEKVVAEQRKPLVAAPEPISEVICYLRLRYWDGTAWSESWSETTLPRGIEVTLASEAPSQTNGSGNELGEVFRRVICLPAGSPGSAVAARGNGGDSATSSEEVQP
jgi:type II secretory pathway pseudopilin PulG